MPLDLIGELRVVGAGRKKRPRHFDNLLPGHDQPRVAAQCVVLCQAFAQLHQQQAHLITQLPAGNQPGQWLCLCRGCCICRDGCICVPRAVGVAGAQLAQKCVAFRVVDHQFQSEHTHIIARRGLQPNEIAPARGILIAVDDAPEQVHQHPRQLRS